MSSPFQNNANIRLEAVFCIDVSIEGIFYNHPISLNSNYLLENGLVFICAQMKMEVYGCGVLYAYMYVSVVCACA